MVIILQYIKQIKSIGDIFYYRNNITVLSIHMGEFIHTVKNDIPRNSLRLNKSNK